MENWKEENNTLHKIYMFSSFEAAMAFMQHASAKISELNHHPEWSNVYNKVSVRLTTHDAGNVITRKDRELASLLDSVFDALNELP